MTTEPDADADRAVPSDTAKSGTGPEDSGRMLILAPADNVAVVVARVPRGGILRAATGESVEAVDDVPRAHKVALRDLPEGAGIRKYGEIIGITTRDIRCGEHVHVHNVESQRLRGDLATGTPGHIGANDAE